MRTSFRKVLAHIGRFARPAARPTASRRARPELETLEDRRLPSAYPITDLTQWAQQFGGPTGPQALWLNFDGYKAQGIDAFAAPSGQDRDATIQDILYRTQETFSPFNVQVRRQTGDGTYISGGGATTVFIGGNQNNVARLSGILTKFTYSSTPFQYSDYPSAFRGIDHIPNSDPFDLAYIDPMAYGGVNATDHSKWANVESDDQVAQGIAHEAGHTFGLAHVLSSPINDTMSYDAGNQYFANKPFAITDLNNSGTSTGTDSYHERPESHLDLTYRFGALQYAPAQEIPIAIQTQNSFTYLQTVLGKRYSDGYVHVSDANTVDPSSNNKPSYSDWFIGPGPGVHGALGRPGDFDVYKIYSPYAKQYHIDVTPDRTTPYLYPDVMVKDGSGNIVAFSRASNSFSDAQVSFQAAVGKTYVVVVGSEDTYNSGGFTIGVTANDPVPVLTGATFKFTPPGAPNFVLGRLVIQSEDVNSGTFSGVYTDTFGVAIPVSGRLTGTATSGGVTTSGFSFGGAAVGFGQSFVQYTGTLTGKGNASLTGWADALNGTVFEQDLQYFSGQGLIPIWSWSGPARGTDF